ncbi:hypothetical protein F5878DRAFT_634457 [Lentinula raphanica]|uniref:Uncharacterized protein n=1 Tax=Lentinula raphanica TaxID=153919 RepID=A0AA38NY26_9AGAR|nr:hypothetical protein F5878DRAFT_634457 [Lentinula raphanica]
MKPTFVSKLAVAAIAMAFLQATVALPTGLTFTGTSTATAPLASGSTEAAAIGDESLSSTSSPRLSGNGFGHHQASNTVSQLATPDTESAAAAQVSTDSAAGFQKPSVSTGPNLEAGKPSSTMGDADDWFYLTQKYGTSTKHQ